MKDGASQKMTTEPGRPSKELLDRISTEAASGEGDAR
jgi:hypothetical protein